MFLKFFGKNKIGKNAVQSLQEKVRQPFDEQMKYCPSCGDEYRSDIVDCFSCKVSLITGSEKIALEKERQSHLVGRSMDLLPEDEMVEIRKGGLQDIKYLQKILAAEMIPSLVVSEEGNCSKGCCGTEMLLQIRKTDTSFAMEILARDFVKSTSLKSHDLSNAEAVIDLNAAETLCPACGCLFSPTVGACPDCGLCFE
jgi:hypothetical protein